MMLRFLLVVLAVWIAIVLVRSAMQRRRARDGGRPLAAVETVRCARCGVHVPAHRALQHVDGRHYCSPDHADGDR
ncbi:MAG: PP0621 family protein [Gammaproteobacteria bacterium]|nr:PP0621 family protein [Gammaproteobacteria bacterium]